MPSSYDLTVVQGDTVRWAMYLKDQGGTAYNLSGCTLSMQFRKGYYPASLVSSYSTHVPSGTSNVGTPEGIIGGLSASATGGTIYIALGSTYTGQFSSEATGKYDIQILNPTGNTVTTILRGSITILPEVTRL